MDKPFELQSFTVEQLLGQHNFRIPSFQRDFSWKESNYQDLVDDLYNAMKKQDFNYFLGNILLISSDNKKMVHITDGQQRITSIYLLLAGIRTQFIESGKPGLGNVIKDHFLYPSNMEDEKNIGISAVGNEFFMRELLLEETIVDDKESERAVDNRKEENEKLKLALSYFRKAISQEKMEEGLQKKFESVEEYLRYLGDFRDTLLNTSVSVIYSKDEKTSYIAFENLNSKGLPLSDVDLIKNRIIYNRPDELDVSTIVNMWSEDKRNALCMNQYLNKGNYPNINSSFDWLVNMFWIYYYTKITRRYRNNSLYISFKRGLSSDQYISFLARLRDFISSFKILTGSFPKDWTTQDDKRNQYYIKWIALLLKFDADKYKHRFRLINEDLLVLINTIIGYRVKNILRPKQTADFFQSLLYNMALIRLLEKGSLYYDPYIRRKFKGAEYKNLLNKLFNKTDLKRHLYEATNDLNLMNDDLAKKLQKNSLEIAQNLKFTKKNVANNAIDHRILIKFILELNFLMSNSREVGDTNMSVEHLIPEDSVNKPETLEIGNLILLEEKLNKGAQDKPILEKKVTYEQSTNKEFKSFMKNWFDKYSSNDWKLAISKRNGEQIANFSRFIIQSSK